MFPVRTISREVLVTPQRLNAEHPPVMRMVIQSDLLGNQELFSASFFQRQRECVAKQLRPRRLHSSSLHNSEKLSSVCCSVMLASNRRIMAVRIGSRSSNQPIMKLTSGIC